MESGFLQHIASTLFLPMYMWVVFGFLRKYAPKIFCRVGLGALFLLPCRTEPISC